MVRSGLQGCRVGVVDNGANTYYGTVAGLISAGEELYVRCDYDSIEKKEKVAGKVSAVQRAVTDYSVSTITIPICTLLFLVYTWLPLQYFHWSMVVPDVGSDSLPAEYNTGQWTKFVAAVGNAHAGQEVTTTSNATGFIESVDEVRNHVVCVDADLQSIFFVKIWHLVKFHNRNAPLQPR